MSSVRQSVVGAEGLGDTGSHRALAVAAVDERLGVVGVVEQVT